MKLFGIVARSRINEPESGRPAVEAEYLTALEPVTWTTCHREALPMDWDAARVFAAANRPALVLVREVPVRPKRRFSMRHVSPQEVFARLERQHLA